MERKKMARERVVRFRDFNPEGIQASDDGMSCSFPGIGGNVEYEVVGILVSLSGREYVQIEERHPRHGVDIFAMRPCDWRRLVV